MSKIKVNWCMTCMVPEIPKSQKRFLKNHNLYLLLGSYRNHFVLS